MRDFLKDFSAGNIGVKYYLVKPLYTKRVRFLIPLIVSLLIIALALFVVKTLDSRNINGWVIAIVFLIILIIPSFILGKVLLRYNKTGKIYFKEDFVLIEAENELTIPYEDIIKIEYCGSLPKSYLHGDHVRMEYQTYKLRFFTDINKSVTVEATKDIFLLPAEKNQFSKVYPIIERTIKAIEPKYGITENPKLRRA